MSSDNPTENPLYLIDVMGIVFRSYYALPSLTRRDGTPIGALFGYCSMLLKLISEKKIGGIIAVFDSPGPTFRKDLYDQYKANRGDPPEDLVPQFAFIERATTAFSIPAIAQSGYEADDIIASIVAKRPANLPVYVVSTDKDLMQLVSDNVYVYDAYKQIRYDADAVQEKFGVLPKQMRDWLALVGDASDNIPGVAGVGPKTASKLLAAHGTIEGIREAIPQMKASKMKEKLAAAGASLDLSRKLVSLAEDCTVDDGLTAAYAGWSQSQLVAFFDEFELRRLKRRVLNAVEPPSDSTTVDVDAKSAGVAAAPAVQPATNLSTGRRDSIALPALQNAPVVLQSRSDVTRWIESATLPIALHFVEGPDCTDVALADHNSVLAIATNTEDDLLPSILTALASVSAALGGDSSSNPGSASGEGALIVHDVKTLLSRAAVFADLASLQLSIEDTMLAAYLILSDRQVMNTSWTVQHLFQIAPDEISKEVNILIEQLSGRRDLVVAEAIDNKRVASSDDQLAHWAKALFCAHCQHSVWQRLYQVLESAQLYGLYHQIELPLAQVLSQLERKGCLVDQPLLRTLGLELSDEIDAISSEIKCAARIAKDRGDDSVTVDGNARSDELDEVNLNSPKQLAVLLFETLGLTPIKKTKTGYSTDSEVLEQLALVHPLPQKILRYRMLTKLKSTYVDQLQSLVSPKDGRVHGSFNQAVAATGRLSSSDPNLQNIPIRSPLGQRIRTSFTAPHGWQILAADYSQVELRVLAHLSQDPALISAFRDGEDIHMRTARQIFGSREIGADEVDVREQRRVAKAVNFGVVYGQGGWGLAKQLGITRKAAKQYIEQYFEHFSGVASYMQRLIVDAKETGQVMTLYGRRRQLIDINSSNARKRDAAERIARNTPIQGTAADIIKLAMLSVSQWIALHGNDAIHMILSVHDELVFEVRDDVADTYAGHIKALMEQVAQLDVPLIVDIGLGPNWGTAH